MSQDGGSCPKNEKTDVRFSSFIGMWVKWKTISLVFTRMYVANSVSVASRFE